MNQKYSDKPPKSRLIFSTNLKAMLLKVSSMVPSNCSGNSNHKLNIYMLFDPIAPVLTETISIQNLTARSGTYVAVYMHMFTKEIMIKGKLVNMNAKVKMVMFYCSTFHLLILLFSSVPVNWNFPSIVDIRKSTRTFNNQWLSS